MKQTTNINELTEVSSTLAFEGLHKQFTHYSKCNNCTMKFAIYLPEEVSESNKMPVLYWLSGLTCTDENFMQKAGALKMAAKLGMIIVAPDTSPRGEDVPDDAEGAYDFGLGAGFYLNASQEPYAKNYNMYSYVVNELISVVEQNFPASQSRAISGHSMGGHGALTIALKHSDLFTSVSAFSPICNPINCQWGQKAFSLYLGDDKTQWLQYDTCELLKKASTHIPMLIEQGSADQFLAEQLNTDSLTKLAETLDYPMQVNMREGYDHSYYFISSFIDKHLVFHAEHLS